MRRWQRIVGALLASLLAVLFAAVPGLGAEPFCKGFDISAGGHSVSIAADQPGVGCDMCSGSRESLDGRRPGEVATRKSGATAVDSLVGSRLLCHQRALRSAPVGPAAEGYDLVPASRRNKGAIASAGNIFVDKYDSVSARMTASQFVATETGINEQGGVGDKSYGPEQPAELGHSERELKEAEKELRRNRDFRDWFHKEYKGDVGQSVGGKSNPDLGRNNVRDAFEEWRGQGSPGRSSGRR